MNYVQKKRLVLFKKINMKCFNLSSFNFEERAYLKILHFKLFFIS